MLRLMILDGIGRGNDRGNADNMSASRWLLLLVESSIALFGLIVVVHVGMLLVEVNVVVIMRMVSTRRLRSSRRDCWRSAAVFLSSNIVELRLLG